MQASSAYDFEHFTDKIKKQNAITLKEIERETAEYVFQKEHETAHSIALWLEQAQDTWDKERNTQYKVNRHRVESQTDEEWSAFLRERRSVLRATLKIQLKENFSSFSECFISTIVQKYDSGSFSMPQRFISLVKNESFIMHSSEKEEIIFTSGNLFIEYSVERILEELEDELTAHLHMEVKKWQK